MPVQHRLSKAPNSVKVDNVSPQHWLDLFRDFADFSIFQCPEYELARSGRHNVSNIIVSRGGSVIGGAQARIVRVPLFGAGLAYLRWAPVWKPRGMAADPEAFRMVLRALKEEYVMRRGLGVRIIPNLHEAEGTEILQILREEGFRHRNRSTVYRTILMDLTPSLEELTAGLHQKWRNCLHSARKRNLQLVQGKSDELYASFIRIFEEMRDRKLFIDQTDVNSFRQIQQALPPAAQMLLVLCLSEGAPCAGAICSALGQTGIYLFGATSNAGTKTNGSYLVQWKMVEWLKELGCVVYNLNGADPNRNEGTYRFKSRLAGANGKEVRWLGEFEAYPNARYDKLIEAAERCRTIARRIRECALRLRGRRWSPAPR